MADSSIRPTRTNGLSRPYTLPQVSVWILLPTLVIEFLLVVSPLLPLAVSIPITIFFCGLAGASACYGFVTMKIDPSDPLLLRANGGGSNNNENENDERGIKGGNGTTNQRPESLDPQDPTKQCWICDVQVREKSMHCKFCNKCVDEFDHHCMWLNTCVGKANYKYFFRTMVCIKIMLIVRAAVQVGLIVDIYCGNGATKQRASDWFSAGTPIPVVAIMGFFLLLDLVASSLIGQLLLLHLRLQREGISTYQFVVRENQIRREKTQKMNGLNVRRKIEIASAKEAGDTCRVVRLEQGGYWRERFGTGCIDPLTLDEESNNNNNGSSSGITNGNENDSNV
mmetsp:Transcript_17752/g.36520  ORF Transcript_17752/g.36520 Transcript_17752/m.36520 type:complete len:339 (-) Transcript_17752:234-1250(-)